MTRRTPLNAELSALPFSTTQARALGVGRGRLAGSDLSAPFHGVRSVGEHSPLASYAPRLRDGDRFSHSSAAELWGAPLPSRLSGIPHVTGTNGLTRPRARGIVGHRSNFGTTVRRVGLPTSDAATTFVELAGLLTEDELVAVGDYLIHSPRVLDPYDIRPHATIDGLAACLDRRPARGVAVARRALRRVRHGVESPRETALRLVLEQAGLPRAECGYQLIDARGRSIGWFDLAWPDWRVIAEYDGDQHRTSRRQYDLDIRRFDAAADEDWRVMRIRSAGLAQPDYVVERVTRALRRNGWRPTGRKSS